MSGIFGQVAPVQVPDFGATMARAQGMQANRLAMLAQQRQMANEDALQGFFAQNAAGFANADPQARMNLLAQLAQQPGGARMALPMMQTLREEMEWSGAGQPAAPAAAPVVQPPPQGGYLDRLVQDESGGRPDARNPRSSATGAAQFIDSTWLQFAQANPQLFQGMSRDQVLAARNDPNLSRQAADWYRRENLTALSGQGLPANDGTAALAHRFGPGDAARLLRADQNAPISSVVSAQIMAANPDLNGRTVGQVVGRYAQRFGGGDTIPAQAGVAPSNDATAIPDGALPHVPGFDMARVQRAINLPNNAAAQTYLRSYLQAAGLVRRGEAARPVEIADPTSPTGRRLVSPQQATGAAAPAPERNVQYVDLGDDAPQGAGRYERQADGSLRRVAAIPAREPTAVDPFGRANTLRDEFTRLTGDFRTVQTAFQNIQANGASQTGAGDMSMLYSFVKLLDPASVVRESEFAAAAASGSFGERVQGAVQRLLTGERLPDSLRNSFLTEARNLFQTQRRAFDRTSQTYRDLATRNGLDPANVVLPFGDDETAQAAPAAPQAAPAQAAPAPGVVQAEPPAGSPRLRYNPRTGRIE